jgi:iron complex outermembrane receptor protein
MGVPKLDPVPVVNSQHDAPAIGGARKRELQMAKSRSLQQAVRFALATATAAAGVSALYAQEAPAPAATEAAPVEEVVVTGSRLSTPNETAISPVTTVSAVDLQQTGLTRVEDVLNNLPMVFAGTNSTTSNGADGTATVDLRGLGNQRTLTLVDGLRLGPGSAFGGRNFSDINQIPAALIERVDILTGGASAVYGADAVAGVVNFILNTHFEGVQINGGYHFNEHDNSNQAGINPLVAADDFNVPSGRVDTAFGKNASILVGSNFADHKGNATAYVTYDNQGAALQSQFDYAACSLSGNNTYAPTALNCAGSSTSAKNGAGGRFLFTGYPSYATIGPPNGYTVDGAHNGNFRPFMIPNDLYNYGPLNYYQTPNERWTAGGFANYDINSHVNVYTSVMWMRNSMVAQIAPSGDFGDGNFVACADPLLNASEQAVFCSKTLQAAQGNPAETFNGVSYPGLNVYPLRRNVEGGNRQESFITNSAREVAGIKGDFDDAQSAWTYNVYAQHSTVDTLFQSLNFLSNTAVEQSLNCLPATPGSKTPVCGGPTNALGVGFGPGGSFIGPSTGNTGFAPNPSIVAWNIWAPNGVTPAAINSISIPEQAQGTVTEYVANGSVTGDIGKYGAKTPWADQGLQLNVGAEWREDSSSYLPDYVSEQGLAAGGGGATPPVAGAFTVKEAFTEMRLPLAQHQAFAEDLSVEAGYRYSKYSEGFDTNTYKFGVDWAPLRDIRFRGSYQRAVRAPNIGELYTPSAVGLDGSLDPCAVPLKPGSTTVLANGVTLAQCKLTGVTPTQFGNILPNTDFQYNGLDGGNPNLQPEKANTYSFGFVFTPRALPSLNASIDYYNIKVADAIDAITENVILSGCINSNGNLAQQNFFCDKIHRSSNGSLWESQSGYVVDPDENQGAIRTQGIDAKVSYRQALATFGSALLSLEGTRTILLETQPVEQFGLSYNCTGYYGATCGGSNSKWRHVFNGTWSTPWDGLDLNLRWRYYGPQNSELASGNPLLNGDGILPFPGTEHIPAYSYFDLTGTFNVYKNVRLELGVNNITDKVPPLVVGADCSTSSPAGANCNGNTFPGVYDAMGRYLFATITAQF